MGWISKLVRSRKRKKTDSGEEFVDIPLLIISFFFFSEILPDDKNFSSNRNSFQ